MILGVVSAMISVFLESEKGCRYRTELRFFRLLCLMSRFLFSKRGVSMLKWWSLCLYEVDGEVKWFEATG